ncbi:MAG: DMT family transporter [Acidobacteria bacterium]|nr:DMT family transporter [Acidobacteriota bacterium]
MDATHIGELVAVLASFLWSATAIAFTAAGRRVGSQAVNFARLPLGVLCLVAAHWVLRGSLWPSAAPSARLWLALSGVIGLTVGDGFLFWSYEKIGPRRALLMLATAPAFTVVFAWLWLGETLSLVALAGIVVIVAGVAMATLGRDDGRGVFANLPRKVLRAGLAAGLLSGVCQGIGATLAKAGMAQLDPLGATVLRMAWATLAMTAAALLSGKLLPWIGAWRDHRAMWPLLAGVVMGPFLGVWFSLIAFKLTTTGVAVALTGTVPITILPFSAVFHHDRPSRLALVGTAIAVAGGAILFLR